MNDLDRLVAIAAARVTSSNTAMTFSVVKPGFPDGTKLYAAPPAAERDESPIDIGGECVPRWVIEYANALTTYFAERGGRSWAIGGVQSREQAPPAAMAVPRLIAALEALADYVDERVGDSECRPLENARAAIAAALAVPAELAAALARMDECRAGCDAGDPFYADPKAWDIVRAHFAQQPAALAVPADNVTPMRQPRADLARLVESINAAVYANGDGLSVTEAIGALELAKLELLKEQEQ